MQILWVEIAFCNESNQLMKFCTTNRNQGIHEFLPLLTKIMSKTYPGHSPFSMYHTFKQLKLLSTIIPQTFISFDTIIKYCNFNLFSLLIINTKSFRSWIDILWYKFILCWHWYNGQPVQTLSAQTMYRILYFRIKIEQHKVTWH